MTKIEMKWFIVEEEQTSGYDCDGHTIEHIVAASSKEEALSLFEKPYEGCTPLSVYPLCLPDISRRRVPFILRPWKEVENDKD